MSEVSRGTEETVEPSRRWLWICLGLHFLVGGIYLAVLPLWGAVPDEPLHYSCIKYDAEFLKQPRITNPRPWGEPLAVYCFTADPAGTGGHGPLYYWASVPLFRLTSGLTVQQQLYVLRVWTLLFSAAMIPLAWWILTRLFPADPGLVVTGTMVVALMPHRLMLSAVVYNDIACATATFLYLWLLLRAAGDGGDAKAWFWAGCGLGLAFLGKRVALVTVPGSVVLLGLQARRLGWSWQRVGQTFGAWVAGALLVAGWWVWRDVRIYGKLLPTEPGFEALHMGWLEQWYGRPPLGPAMVRFKVWYSLRGLWLSLWSQVGWVPWHDAGAGWSIVGRGLYGAFGIGTIAAMVGFAGGLRNRWGGLTDETRDALIGYAAMAAGMVLGAVHWVVLYSFHNNEETGKHAQAILVCLVALAAAAWRWMLGRRRAVFAMAVGVALLIGFNVASIVRLTTYLIPTYRPPTPSLAAERVKDIPSGVAPGIWHRYRVTGTVQRGGYVPRPRDPSEAWHDP